MSDLNRLHEYTEAIIQGCGAVSYLAHTLDATQTTMQTLRTAMDCDPGHDFELSRYAEAANKALALVSEAMNVLGDAQDEPAEDDVKATTAAFRRCRKLLAGHASDELAETPARPA